MADRVFCIKNFEHYQESPSVQKKYRDRKMPWVKLYFDLWTDVDFFRLPVDAKLLYVGLLTLANQTKGNTIPDDPDLVGVRLALKNVNFEPLIRAGFLIIQGGSQAVVRQTSSRPPADLQPTSSVDRDRELETETESESDKISDDHFARFWKAYPRNDDKQKAAKAFAKLTAKQQELAIADVPRRISANWAGREHDYFPYAASYLNQHQWEDELTGQSQTGDQIQWGPPLSTEAAEKVIERSHAEYIADRDKRRAARGLPEIKFEPSTTEPPTGESIIADTIAAMPGGAR
jgi:hypothetical protein